MNQQTYLKMESHLSVRAVLSLNIFSILLFWIISDFLNYFYGKNCFKCQCRMLYSLGSFFSLAKKKKKKGEREKYMATSFLLAKVCF